MMMEKSHSLRNAMNNYFYQNVPAISSRNILRKNQQKEQPFYPIINQQEANLMYQNSGIMNID